MQWKSMFPSYVLMPHILLPQARTSAQLLEPTPKPRDPGSLPRMGNVAATFPSAAPTRNKAEHIS